MNKLVIPKIPPSTNAVYRIKIAGLNGRRTTFMTKEGQDFKEFASLQALSQAGRNPLKGRVWVRYDFYFKDLRGDLANREKLLTDSLQGIIFDNDSQIDEMTLKRRIDKKNPRVEVYYEEI